MKKLTVLLLLMTLVVATLAAENSFWVGKAPYGATWEDEGNYVFTSLYEVGSTVFITYGSKTIQASVIEPLPKTLEGRDFGLSQGALEALDLWGKGDTVVSVRLKSGAMVEEEEIDYTDSGWYTLLLGEMTGKEAMEAFRKLSGKGFKLALEKTGDKVLVSVPYIVEYEVEERTKMLKKLGYPVMETQASANPYN